MVSKVDRFRRQIVAGEVDVFRAQWQQSRSADQKRWAPALFGSAVSERQNEVGLLLLKSDPALLKEVCRAGNHELLTRYLAKNNLLTVEPYLNIAVKAWLQAENRNDFRQTISILARYHLYRCTLYKGPVELTLQDKAAANLVARELMPQLRTDLDDVNVKRIKEKVLFYKRPSVADALELLKDQKYDAIRIYIADGGFRSLHVEQDTLLLVEITLDTLKRQFWEMSNTSRNKAKVNEALENRDKMLSGVGRSSADVELPELAYLILEKINSGFARPYYPFTHEKKDALKSWYEQALTKRSTAVSYDMSDNSDNEDNIELAQGFSRKRKKAHARNEYIKEIYNTPERNFWQRTTRPDLLAKSLDAKQLHDSRYLQKRARLSFAEEDEQDGHEFVAVYRGVDLSFERWVNKARRKYYYLDGVGEPYYSESSLMADDNFYLKGLPADMQVVDAEAERIQAQFAEFSASGACIASTVKPRKGLFFFNSFADLLSHQYTNGINEHLLRIANVLNKREHWLKGKFRNAYNYAVSTSERPYHSLRYAFGLKGYYPNSFNPLYAADGSLAHCHAGKLHIFLFKKEKLLANPQLIRVAQSCYQGKLPVGRDIIPEIELTFIGKVDGEHSAYELPLKYPSFDQNYKDIYEIKYGFNKELYDYFAQAIKESKDDPVQRQEVVTLLKEWLCAYYEVLAIDIAGDLAKNKYQGKLVYLDKDDNATDIPISGPLKKGAGNLQDRNTVHGLENCRRVLAEQFLSDATTETDDLVQLLPKLSLRTKVKKELRKKPTSTFFKSVAYGHGGKGTELSKQQDAERIAQGLTYEEAQIRETHSIITENVDTFDKAHAQGEQVTFRF